MKKIFTVGVALAVATAAYAIRVTAFYDGEAILVEYFEYEKAAHGAGLSVAWDLAGPLAVELSAAATNLTRRPGYNFPEHHYFPASRLQIPLAAAITSSTSVGRLTVYAVAGGGVNVERYRYPSGGPEAMYEIAPLAVWGAGMRVGLAGRFYAEFSPRFYMLGGDELLSVEPGDDRHYSEGHAAKIAVFLGGGVSF
jgi:hypothetical protein